MDTDFENGGFGVLGAKAWFKRIPKGMGIQELETANILNWVWLFYFFKDDMEVRLPSCLATQEQS